MANVITWADDELRDSPRESITLERSEVVRRCHVPWTSRIKAARQLLGYYDSNNDPPELYVAPGSSEPMYNVYAYKVDIMPYKEQDDTLAELTVHYKSLEYNDGVLITESLEPSSMFVTLDRKGLNFGTGASKVNLDAQDLQAPAAIICMIDWVYTIRYQLSWSAANFNLVGRVNNNEVISVGLQTTFPAETLLCRNPVARREIRIDGTFSWTISYRFTYMNNGTLAAPYGWNHQIRSDNADATGLKFERLTNNSGAAIPVYQLADFGGLIV